MPELGFSMVISVVVSHGLFRNSNLEKLKLGPINTDSNVSCSP